MNEHRYCLEVKFKRIYKPATKSVARLKRLIINLSTSYFQLRPRK